jgi:uncharacterized protein YecE (DUF72 family)
MSSRYHIAARSLRGSLAAYAKRFDLLEVVVQSAKGGASDPGMSTLRKWRKQVPPHFHFAVVAPAPVARLKPGADLDRELDVVHAAIATLQARCFVLRTPADVTPSALTRTRLEKLFARFPRDATHLVWEPSGLWEIDDAAVVARKIGVVLAVDPARDPVPAGNVAYVRLRAFGETRSFSEAALERIVHKIGARREVYAVLESDNALKECRRLRKLAQGGPRASEGGMTRLVRPRGGIVVRDDEQE